MKALTIRNLPDDVARALEAARRKGGHSLNQTVIALLQQSLGVRRAVPSNGLRSLAGSWSQAELRRFERSTEVFEQIDEDLWH